MPKRINFSFITVILIIGLVLILTAILPAEISYAESPLTILDEIHPNRTRSILPDFTGLHGSQPHRFATELSYSPGVISIGSAILYIIDFFKYIMASIAVLFMVIAGIRLITGGKKAEEVITKEKDNIKYIIMGLLIIILARPAVQEVFFGEGGEFLTDKSIAEDYALKGEEYVRGLYSFIEMFLGAIAVLVIVLAGFRMMASGGEENAINAEKKHIFWAIVGLIIVGLSEAIVKNVVFVDGGTKTDFKQGWSLIIMLTNFFAGIIAVLAILMLIYGGFLYVTSAGEDTLTGKARKLMLGSVIAIVLATSAYALVNTFLQVAS